MKCAEIVKLKSGGYRILLTAEFLEMIYKTYKHGENYHIARDEISIKNE